MMDTALLTPPAPAFIRLLARVLDASLDAPGCTLLERLAQWLDWNRAVALAKVLDGPMAGTEGEGEPRDALLLSCLRSRQALRVALADETAWPAAPVTDSAEAGYAPLRAYYLAQQRKWMSTTGYLRGQLRERLLQGSPEQARLAALDGVMEATLSPREQTLLAVIPELLGKRYAQLHSMAGESLSGFRGDMRHVLQAELDLRFQPIDGLLTAL